MERRSGFAPLCALLFVAAAGIAHSQARELSWPSIAVTATLDADGRLHVAERQVMRFTGEWNGGERIFRTRLGQRIAFKDITRLDPVTGVSREMHAGSLDQVDGYQLTDGALRWRSRMPSDPPFDRTDLVYVIEVEYENVLVPVAEGHYRLSHDFAFSNREGRIDRFDVTLTLDTVWTSGDQSTWTFTSQDLYPGTGFVVELPLRYTGATLPAAVLHGVSQEARRNTAYALAAAFLLLFVALLRRESRLGRFASLIPKREITKEWLDHHVFARPPEVIGADWDDHTAAPEVAATLARMVQEKKLSSSVTTDSLWIFKTEVLHLKLEVDKSQLRGHELALVNALFEGHRETTSTKETLQEHRFRPGGAHPGAARPARRDDHTGNQWLETFTAGHAHPRARCIRAHRPRSRDTTLRCASRLHDARIVAPRLRNHLVVRLRLAEERERTLRARGLLARPARCAAGRLLLVRAHAGSLPRRADRDRRAVALARRAHEQRDELGAVPAIT